MAGAQQKAKDSAMASDLVKRGIYHGKRMTSGLDNVPKMGETGSAAYRRMQDKKKK